jgi:Mlc titration factor MtfA (ptsG expression regulator)
MVDSTALKGRVTPEPPSAWARGERLTALVFATLTLLVCGLGALVLERAGVPLFATAPVVIGCASAAFLWGTRRLRRRRWILRQHFPPDWEAVLQRDVVFFRVLDHEAKQRFRRQVQVFLGEKAVTGITMEVDTTTRVLTAASAIIPIFGFPDWEWHQISEVLIYPSRFTQEFSIGDTPDHRTLGMVGTGAMNRVMILSKPDLLAGFRNAGDKRNVGVHEFAHLVDKSDGAVDGVPAVGLDHRAVGPWLDLVRRKTREIETGTSDINSYALTSETEFFAVVSEYFFERPGVMRQKHPELYDALEGIFNQDLRSRLTVIHRELTKRQPRFGRNSPCPCGSGRKFKKCCLR